MATFFIPVPAHDPVANLARYFSEKKALSKETSVEVPDVDWIAMGLAGYTNKPGYPFIKEENGKFWLDEEELKIYNEKVQKESKKRLTLFFVLMAFLLVIAVGVFIFITFIH